MKKTLVFVFLFVLFALSWVAYQERQKMNRKAWLQEKPALEEKIANQQDVLQRTREDHAQKLASIQEKMLFIAPEHEEIIKRAFSGQSQETAETQPQ